VLLARSRLLRVCHCGSARVQVRTRLNRLVRTAVQIVKPPTRRLQAHVLLDKRGSVSEVREMGWDGR